jgi:uncharacterized membrane protein
MIRSELKKNAKNQLKNNWLLAIGVLIVCQLISYIPNILSIVSEELIFIGIVIPIVTLAITGPLSIGQCKFFINLANKSNPKFSDLWYGFNNILKAIGVALLVGIIVFLGSLLFVIPGIIFAYRYSQVYYIMAENPDISVLDCLRESARIMKGHKMELFKLELSFIGWHLLSIATLGIGYVFLRPYIISARVAFYRELCPAELLDR